MTVLSFEPVCEHVTRSNCWSAFSSARHHLHLAFALKNAPPKAGSIRSACAKAHLLQRTNSSVAERLGDPPGGSVRDAGVENLSLANEIVQSTHDFFHWCDPIPDVHPLQVDEVGLQPLQTGFHCLHHALAVIARRIRITAWRGVGVLRG